MRGTELGNDESRLADSGLCDAYEVRRIQCEAQSASFEVLRAWYDVLSAGIEVLRTTIATEPDGFNRSRMSQFAKTGPSASPFIAVPAGA
jgi:hypothetical protein